VFIAPLFPNSARDPPDGGDEYDERDNGENVLHAVLWHTVPEHAARLLTADYREVTAPSRSAQGGASATCDRPARTRRLSVPLHHQQLADGAAALPVGRVDLLDVPDLGPAVMLELGAVASDRVNV
jgi:hypothetical protein